MSSLSSFAIVPASRVLAQSSGFEGKPIVDIQFPNGQPLDPADLARVQPLKKGQPLHSAAVAQRHRRIVRNRAI